MANRSATRQWDYVEAEKAYTSDQRLSYREISNRFGISLSTVKRYAALRDWPKRRQNATESGLAKHESRVIDEIAEADKRHLRMARTIQAVGNNALVLLGKQLQTTENISTGNIQSAASTLKEGILLERIILGLPSKVISQEFQSFEEERRPRLEDAATIMKRMQDRQKKIERLRKQAV